MRNLTFTLIFLLTSLMVIAQGSISGVILDAETNEGLIGASILVGGTSKGAITDLDGSFQITDLAPGEYTLQLTYTGYAAMEKVATVGSGDTDIGSVNMEFESIGLAEVSVIASVAVDRKTPVAVTTISGEKIENLVGNQEYPEILRKTPSVYVTKEGGGFGDSRINIRGFDQRNTAVMINGIPVNDMENGWVYWSNWAGLSDVTSNLQVQRGLGASKLAVASVGGSINIITNAAEMRKGGAASLSIGNDGFLKTGLTLSSGLGEKGWAFSAQGTRTQGNGYVDGTKFSAWSYFLSATKQFSANSSLSFTVLGAPQWHHQRLMPGNFDGVNLRTFVDPDNTGEEFTNMGTKFNWYHGQLDGEEFSFRRNFYHKPKAFLNHYLTISPKTDIKTSAYVSLGRGGGTGPRGRFRTPGSMFDTDFRIRNSDGSVRFDDIVRYNQGATISGWGDPKEVMPDGPAAGSYVVSSNGRINGERYGSGLIRRASMNSHNWFGVLSTLTHSLNSKLTLTAGLDGRYYKGIHYRRLENLLGADAYLSGSDENNPANYITDEVAAEFGSFADDTHDNGNNVLNYYNDGLVKWLGVFTQLEYTTEKLSVFASLSGSNQSFKRIDYFNYLENDSNRESDWEAFLGGTVKLGLNYNIDNRNNVFINGGFFSRQPIFDNVFINFVNEVNEDVKNQNVKALEVGYGFRSSAFRSKLNLYYTEWGNRQFDRSIDNAEGQEILFQFEGVAQRHLGVEVELSAYVNEKLELTGMVSLGDWKYSSDFLARGTNIDLNQPEGESTLYADGLKVGDAAQTTFSLGAVYKPVKGLRIYADYYLADNLYADYSVVESQFFSPGGEVVKLPSYSLVDAGISYKFDIQGIGAVLRFNMNNVLDEEYISELETNVKDDPSTSINEFYDNRGIFGFGRTWNTGLKIIF